MSDASIAAAFVAVQASQLQTAIAAKLLRFNAQGAADAAKVLDTAAKNLNQLANVASGVGESLDIST